MTTTCSCHGTCIYVFYMCYQVDESCKIDTAPQIILACRMPSDIQNSITGHADLLLLGKMSKHKIQNKMHEIQNVWSRWKMHEFKWKQCFNFVFLYINKIITHISFSKNITIIQYQNITIPKDSYMVHKDWKYEFKEYKKGWNHI